MKHIKTTTMLRVLTLSLLFLIVAEACDCDKKKKTENMTLVTGKMKKYRDVDETQEEKPAEVTRDEHTGVTPAVKVLEPQQNYCLYFTSNEELEVDNMIDIWEIVYYRSQIKLNCFRFIIRKVPEKTKILNKKKYGNFNGTINWDDCNLQIISNAKEPTVHYLQGSKNPGGILENIIITEEDREDTTILTLHEHSPNQWMVMDELLLMRECDNGDILIFSRVPFQPKISQINDALVKFREEPNQYGKWACYTYEEAKDSLPATGNYHISIS